MAIRYIDLFCGIGGFRLALDSIDNESKCVLSCDIDIRNQITYKENFSEIPLGDIANINENDIPNFDILFAGFPCQPFSIIGNQKGLLDKRGNLFNEITRILKYKKPDYFILENVKQIKTHDSGRTFQFIIDSLINLGYNVQTHVLNALNFGLPQKRERIFILGSKSKIDDLIIRNNNKPITLDDLLEKQPDQKYYASKYIRQKNSYLFNPFTSIWHENKSGNISILPYSCALRSSASHNYLLVNGERRLTEREMLRLQGFPETFKIIGNYSTLKFQTGNTIAIPCVASILQKLIK